MTTKLSPRQKKRTNLVLFNAILAWLDSGGEKIFGKQLKFNMAEWIETNLEDKDTLTAADKKKTVYSCATTCCIGGAAVLFGHKSKTMLQFNRTLTFDDTEAPKLLGISYTDAAALFYPHEAEGESRFLCYHNIPPAFAAAVIRHYLNTGVVNWQEPW